MGVVLLNQKICCSFFIFFFFFFFVCLVAVEAGEGHMTGAFRFLVTK